MTLMDRGKIGEGWKIARVKFPKWELFPWVFPCCFRTDCRCHRGGAVVRWAAMKGKSTILIGSSCLLAGLALAAELEVPVRLKAAGEPVRVESPGYAAPCWADIDKDGDKDLLVGQFHGGKIKVYRNHGKGLDDLGAGEWLEFGGKPVRVPGIW